MRGAYLLATPVQRIDGSYHLLKDALKKNDIKTVYLDMYYKQYRSIPKERTDVQMDYIYCITDYMPMSVNKASFLLEASGADRYIENFLPAARYGNYLLDYERMERIIKAKRTEEYRNYGVMPTMWNSEYAFCQGSPRLYGYIEEGELEPVGDMIMSDYSLRHLDKMVKLCKDNDIELVLLVTPVSNFWLEAMGDYDKYYEFLKDYAEEADVEYYDFNLVRDEVFHQVPEYYIDTHHLSGQGALDYTKLLCDMMRNIPKEDRDELFYASIEEKLQAVEPQVFGIAMKPVSAETQTESSGGSGMYSICAASNYDVTLEWRLVRLDEEGNEIELITDFSTDVTCSKDLLEGNKIRIYGRDVATGDILIMVDTN